MNARFETMEKHIKGLTDLVESLDGNNKHRNSFSIWVFCHEHSRITGLQGGGEELPPAPQTLTHISQAITAGSSPLHVASSRTRTGNLYVWFPSASR